MPVPAAQWDLLGFGAVTVDDVICVDHFPPPDTKAAIVSRQQLSGGVTATALVAAARLGTRAAYCGVRGDDERPASALSSWSRQEWIARRSSARPTRGRWRLS